MENMSSHFFFFTVIFMPPDLIHFHEKINIKSTLQKGASVAQHLRTIFSKSKSKMLSPKGKHCASKIRI